jgi:hypothetical protein
MMNDTESARRQTLVRLDALVGDWTEQVDVPGAPAGRMSVRWTLDRQFVVQRSEIPSPDFPDSIAIVAVATDGTRCTQHYFDARGIVRTDEMTLGERTWTLLRDQPDFTPLHFAQRFTYRTDRSTNLDSSGAAPTGPVGRTW